MKKNLPISILPQPNEETCGQTCLHAIYRYYGDTLDLEELIGEVPTLDEGGTLDVLLACHALKRGYEVIIYTYNLQVFDPSWFEPKKLFSCQLKEKLIAQAEFKNKAKLNIATYAYLEFLSLGGQICFEDLSHGLLIRHLKQSTPILTGLSSTFLYHSDRVYGPQALLNDIKGKAEGHFVILAGFDNEKKTLMITDPFKKNPYSEKLTYHISIDRVICAILLGILTYDANFIIIRPKKK